MENNNKNEDIRFHRIGTDGCPYSFHDDGVIEVIKDYHKMGYELVSHSVCSYRTLRSFFRLQFESLLVFKKVQ